MFWDKSTSTQALPPRSGICCPQYAYHRKLDTSYISKGNYASDRAAIRGWLIHSLPKASGIWGSGLDTLLEAIRGAIQEHGASGFPAEALQKLMARRGKSLVFTEEEIDDLVEMQYGDQRAFAMLALVFPFVDVAKTTFTSTIFFQNPGSRGQN